MSSKAETKERRQKLPLILSWQPKAD